VAVDPRTRAGTFDSQADCLAARAKGIDDAQGDTAWAEAQEARCFTAERANGGPMNPAEDPRVRALSPIAPSTPASASP
jgi:hypothetical protein